MPETLDTFRAPILLVEDDPKFASAITDLLSAEYEVNHVADPRHAVQLIFQTKPSIVLLDFNLPSMSGLEFLKSVKIRCPEIPFVMLTGECDPETIIESMRAGASDYVIKGSEDFEANLQFRIMQALELSTLKRKHERLSASFAKHFEILGNSASVLAVKNDIAKLKSRDATVLITGENGTGKELVARNLNLQESNAARPFVAVNCSAITSTLFESEFFGHVKGAFTGATDNKHGQFKMADGGDIFLDEIGEVPLELQPKLLRVLQERTFTPVGGTKSIKVNVRVIAATNRNLQEEVRAGRFRQDLYYRRNQFPIRVPSLRERPEDIQELAETFLRRDLPMARFSEPAKELLASYPWPGNIRELVNAVERAAILVRGSKRPVIKPEHLLLDQQTTAPQTDVAIPLGTFPNSRGEVSEANYQAAVAWLEREFIERALNLFRNDNRSVYTLLGMSKAHFFRRKKALGLVQEEEFEDAAL